MCMYVYVYMYCMCKQIHTSVYLEKGLKKHRMFVKQNGRMYSTNHRKISSGPQAFKSLCFIMLKLEDSSQQVFIKYLL